MTGGSTDTRLTDRETDRKTDGRTDGRRNGWKYIQKDRQTEGNKKHSLVT